MQDVTMAMYRNSTSEMLKWDFPVLTLDFRTCLVVADGQEEADDKEGLKSMCIELNEMLFTSRASLEVCIVWLINEYLDFVMLLCFP